MPRKKNPVPVIYRPLPDDVGHLRLLRAIEKMIERQRRNRMKKFRVIKGHKPF